MKKKRLIVSIFSLIVIIVMTVQAVVVEAAQYVDFYFYVPDVTPKDTPGNSWTCTNFASMCIVGNDLYCIKTNEQSYSTALIKYSNYTSINPSANNYKPTPTSVVFIRDSSGNAMTGSKCNGITYYNGYFYIATQSFSVWKVTTGGIFVDSYITFESSSNITTYTNDMFIVQFPGTSTENRFGIVSISNSNGALHTSKVFTVPKLFSSGVAHIYQDIFYSDGFLYIPSWDSINKNYSTIQLFYIGTSASKIVGPYYASAQITVMAAVGSTHEIEAVCAESNGQLYYCTNGSSGADGIYKFGF